MKTAYINSLKAKGGMEIQQESDADLDKDGQEIHVRKVKEALKENLSIDDKAFKDRVKEKKLKAKRKLKGVKPGDDDYGEEGVAVLGTPGMSEDEEEDQSMEEASEEQQSENESEEVPELVEPTPTKRRKTNSDQTGGKKLPKKAA